MKRSRGQRMLQASKSAPQPKESSRSSRRSSGGVVDTLDSSSSQKDDDKQAMKNLSENASRLSRSKGGREAGESSAIQSESKSSTAGTTTTSTGNDKTKKKSKKQKREKGDFRQPVDNEKRERDAALFKIENNFRWLELALSKLSKRVPTWTKIQQYVEQVSKSTFTLHDLSRVLYIWPEGHDVQWKKVSLDLMGQQDIHLCLDSAQPTTSTGASAGARHDESMNDNDMVSIVPMKKDGKSIQSTPTPRSTKDAGGLSSRIDIFRRLLYEKVKREGIDVILGNHDDMIPTRSADPGVFQLIGGQTQSSSNGLNITTTTTTTSSIASTSKGADGGVKDGDGDGDGDNSTTVGTDPSSLRIHEGPLPMSQSSQVSSLRENTFTGRLDMSTKDVNRITSNTKILDMSQLRTIALQREAETKAKERSVIIEKRKGEALTRIRSIPLLCDSLRSYLRAKGGGSRVGNKGNVFGMTNTGRSSNSTSKGGTNSNTATMRAVPLSEAVTALRPSNLISDNEMKARITLIARNIPSYITIVPADVIVKSETLQVNIGLEYEAVRAAVAKFVERNVCKVVEKFGASTSGVASTTTSS